MSVYRRKGSPFYQYEFWWNGLRFRGSTKAKTERAARAAESLKRASLISTGPSPQRTARMSLNEAFGRYTVEHAQFLPSAETSGYYLDALMRGLGKDRLLNEVDEALSAFIAQRRSEVSNASVNRELTALRAVMRRAQKKWKVDIGEMPDWRWHFLPEPQERRRYATEDEKERLLATVRPELAVLARFFLMTGVREMSAISLEWADVDFRGKRINFRVKGGGIEMLPMSTAVMVLLANEQGKHPVRVFTYQARTKRGSRLAGAYQPFTRNGWRKDWKRALDAAGIENLRIHDLRHTAATDVLRKTGNLALVKHMLHHKTITTTTRYAHVLTEDLAAAMALLEDPAAHKNPHTDQAIGDQAIDVIEEKKSA